MKSKALPIALAVLIGLVQSYFLIFCWAYIAAYSPLPHWLVDAGLRDSLRVVLYPIDFLTSVVLSLPAAFAITKLRPRKLWPYLLLAVIPAFVWHNVGTASSPFFTQFAGTIMLGWLPELFALPLAVLLVGRVAPNNSFKPKPLRGSA